MTELVTLPDADWKSYATADLLVVLPKDCIVFMKIIIYRRNSHTFWDRYMEHHYVTLQTVNTSANFGIYFTTDFGALFYFSSLPFTTARLSWYSAKRIYLYLFVSLRLLTFTSPF